jgi:hypothetical protein
MQASFDKGGSEVGSVLRTHVRIRNFDVIRASLRPVSESKLERRIREKYAAGYSRTEVLSVVVHLTDRGPRNFFPRCAEARRRPATLLLPFDLEKLDFVGALRTVQDGEVIKVVEHGPIVRAGLVDLQQFRQRDVCLKGVSGAGSSTSLLTRLCRDERRR